MDPVRQACAKPHCGHPGELLVCLNGSTLAWLPWCVTPQPLRGCCCVFRPNPCVVAVRGSPRPLCGCCACFAPTLVWLLVRVFAPTLAWLLCVFRLNPCVVAVRVSPQPLCGCCGVLLALTWSAGAFQPAYCLRLKMGSPVALQLRSAPHPTLVIPSYMWPACLPISNWWPLDAL
jgi:hypothetical protein